MKSSGAPSTSNCEQALSIGACAAGMKRTSDENFSNCIIITSPSNLTSPTLRR
jgi:hypothetical protein